MASPRRRSILLAIIGCYVVVLCAFIIRADPKPADLVGHYSASQYHVPPQVAVEADPTPDRPIAIDEDASWIAVRSSDPDSVSDVLGLQDLRMANWQSGMEFTGYDDENATVFVTPPVDGWTLIIGDNLPIVSQADDRYALAATLRDLARRFDEVHYFTSYEGGEVIGWVRIANDSLVRAFVRDDTGIEWEAGVPTEAESVTVDGLKRLQVDGTWPGPVVFDLARQWSVDPLSFDSTTAEPGVGRIGRLPDRVCDRDPWAGRIAATTNSGNEQ